MNYVNGVTGAATMQQLQQANQVPSGPHSQRIQILEDSLSAAHGRISELDKMLSELINRVG